MEIHRFEKVWVGLAVLLIVGFIATVTYGAVGAGVAMVNDQGGTVDSQNLDATNFSDPGVRKTGPNTYDVYVVAQQFLFRPGTSDPIVLPANSTVTFYVTSSDVVHGFEVAGTNINTMAIPGQIAEITAEFDEAKEYGIVCHEYCGSGHHDMEGTIEIVPAAEYDGPDNQTDNTTMTETTATETSDSSQSTDSTDASSTTTATSGSTTTGGA
jgi:cytochrome c oxidase subunit 2